MSYLLDTNVCIAFLKGDDEVRDRLLAHQPADLLLCSVVKGELLYGARHSAHIEANLRRLREFFEPFHSLPFDDEAAAPYSVIRAQLSRDGRLIGSNDLMIAATAIANDATLVTRNQDEFQRVSGLRLAQW